VVDRRAVSIDTKWALERIAAIRLRQGLVTALLEADAEPKQDRTAVSGQTRASHAVRVETETAFGETLAGDACVLAVGLSLGGIIRMGEQVLAGGRFAEVAADALKASLLARGVPLRSVQVPVGARLRWSNRKAAELHSASTSSGRSHACSGVDPEGGFEAGFGASWALGAGWCRIPLEGTGYKHRSGGSEGGPTRERRSRSSSPWRDALCAEAAEAVRLLDSWETGASSLPPSPHRPDPATGEVGSTTDTDALGQFAMVGPVDCTNGQALLVPDGTVTSEWYASPSLGPVLATREAWKVSRPEFVVESALLDGLSGHGQVPSFERVWACGQLAGAGSYLESLESGARVAADVCSFFFSPRGGAVRTPGG
jgi:hypothetical protein